MEKIITADATPQQLNLLIAMIEDGIDGSEYHVECAKARKYMPATNWADGGPIIDREDIQTAKASGGWLCIKGSYLRSKHDQDTGGYVRAFGATKLIAAMRCVAKFYLGAEVEIK